MIIDLLHIKNKDKAKEWINILNSNPGSAKIENNKIIISSHIFMQLIGLEGRTLQGIEMMEFIQLQQVYSNNYDLVQLTY